MARKIKLLMVDNYDSFTFNIVQYFGELGAEVEVFRNDEITLEAIAAKQPDRLVISPGPCSPAEGGGGTPHCCGTIRSGCPARRGPATNSRPMVRTGAKLPGETVPPIHGSAVAAVPKWRAIWLAGRSRR